MVKLARNYSIVEDEDYLAKVDITLFPVTKPAITDLECNHWIQIKGITRINCNISFAIHKSVDIWIESSKVRSFSTLSPRAYSIFIILHRALVVVLKNTWGQFSVMIILQFCKTYCSRIVAWTPRECSSRICLRRCRDWK